MTEGHSISALALTGHSWRGPLIGNALTFGAVIVALCVVLFLTAELPWRGPWMMETPGGAGVVHLLNTQTGEAFSCFANIEDCIPLGVPD